MSDKLKTLKALPKAKMRHAELPPPEPVVESSQKALARLNNELVTTTENLRQLKANWAKENMEAQRHCQTIPTSKLTWVSEEKRKLADRIAAIQTEIGEVGRQSRLAKVMRQNGRHTPEPEPVRQNGVKKTMPLKESPDFLMYFHLSAQNELTPDLYKQVCRVAKSMAASALAMGISE